MLKTVGTYILIKIHVEFVICGLVLSLWEVINTVDGWWITEFKKLMLHSKILDFGSLVSTIIALFQNIIVHRK